MERPVFRTMEGSLLLRVRFDSSPGSLPSTLIIASPNARVDGGLFVYLAVVSGDECPARASAVVELSRALPSAPPSPAAMTGYTPPGRARPLTQAGPPPDPLVDGGRRVYLAVVSAVAGVLALPFGFPAPGRGVPAGKAGLRTPLS